MTIWRVDMKMEITRLQNELAECRRENIRLIELHSDLTLAAINYRAKFYDLRKNTERTRAGDYLSRAAKRK